MRSSLGWLALLLAAPLHADLDQPLYVTNRNGTVSRVEPNGTATTVISGFEELDGIGFDTHGNLYVVEEHAGEIWKFPGGAGPPVRLTFGLDTPKLMTLNANNLIYVAEGGIQSSVGRVTRVLPDGTKQTVDTFPGDIPFGARFDLAGNLNVTIFNTGEVFRYTGASLPKTLVATIPGCTGMAGDLAGNLFVASFPLGQLWRIPLAGTASLYATGLHVPDGIAVEADGDIFAAEVIPGGRVWQVPAGGGPPVPFSVALPFPDALSPLVGPGSPPPTPTIPTLGEWGLIALGGSLLIAMLARRRRSALVPG
jgi:hypothetical protein